MVYGLLSSLIWMVSKFHRNEVLLMGISLARVRIVKWSLSASRAFTALEVMLSTLSMIKTYSFGAVILMISLVRFGILSLWRCCCSWRCREP